MLEIKVENGRVRQRAEGNAQSLALDVLCAISAVYNSMCDRGSMPGALFRAIIAAGGRLSCLDRYSGARWRAY